MYEEVKDDHILCVVKIDIFIYTRSRHFTMKDLRGLYYYYKPIVSKSVLQNMLEIVVHVEVVSLY